MKNFNLSKTDLEFLINDWEKFPENEALKEKLMNTLALFYSPYPWLNLEENQDTVIYDFISVPGIRPVGTVSQ